MRQCYQLKCPWMVSLVLCLCLTCYSCAKPKPLAECISALSIEDGVEELSAASGWIGAAVWLSVSGAVQSVEFGPSALPKDSILLFERLLVDSSYFPECFGQRVAVTLSVVTDETMWRGLGLISTEGTDIRVIVGTRPPPIVDSVPELGRFNAQSEELIRELEAVRRKVADSARRPL
jgi:hypothetical protein